MKSIVHSFKNIWGVSVLCGILLTIIILNIKPGYTVLGNDNFSPELDPGLTLSRSVFAPAWRTYRALGIPSDSEQADIFRTALFWILDPVLPTWVISQGYLYLTFFIASISMAALTTLILKRYIPPKYGQLAFLLGGLFYTCSMLTSWIYFYPLHLFVAAYAFLPLVLWRLGAFIEVRNKKNAAWLLLSSCLLSTAALTATMFIVCSLVIVLFSLIFFITVSSSSKEKNKSSIVTVDLSTPSQFAKLKNSILHFPFSILLAALFLTFAPHLPWALPFITYVKTNT